MVISLANSIRFYKADNLMRNFANSRSDQVFDRMIGYCFAQKYLNTDQIPLEVGINDGSTPVVTYNFVTSGGVIITPYYSETIGTITYYYYKINQQKDGYISITNGTDTWYSERIRIVFKAPQIKIQWFNFDDAFDFHYRDELVNIMRFDGVIKDYAPKGKATIFDNQNEEVKLKEILYREQKLIIEAIPAPIAEKVAIAAAHDIFLVNDVEYVTSSLPSIKELDFANIYNLELTITEKFAIGGNRNTSKYIPTPALYYVDSAGVNYIDTSENLYTD